MKSKVMIIDDNGEVRMLLAEFFSSLGCAVIEMSDGVRAVEIAEAETPDLIVMDVVMSGIFGTCASRLLKENQATSAIPIILVSGADKAPEMSAALESQFPAIRFVRKPLDLAKLRRAFYDLLPQDGRRLLVSCSVASGANA